MTSESNTEHSPRSTAKKIILTTVITRELADIHTPVGIYLRLRDRFRDTILLESTDNHAADNSYSFICVNAIAGIEIRENGRGEYKMPDAPAVEFLMAAKDDPAVLIWDFMERFECVSDDMPLASAAQGLYGYTSYDMIPFTESIKFKKQPSLIPLARYRLYQYVIAINHFRDEMLLLENKVEGVEPGTDLIRSLILSKDVPAYPFTPGDKEESNMTDEDYLGLVEKGIHHCRMGDVFQIVMSRRFELPFTGVDFNVYRSLRHINPSPYLFYFDYGDYKIMGSSPESQLKIHNGRAILNPIAGTFLRTGDDDTDTLKATELLNDPKENAEHLMLVDLARNDLSKVCQDVSVTSFRQIQFYSHVIHMVSEVGGALAAGSNPFSVLYQTFPAGTLSGAPKYKAMELIDEYENTSRSFYGGTIGFMGFNGSCNHAILIRSFLSQNNTLTCQAGAGIVAASQPQTELAEIGNKLKALKKAIEMAAKM